MTKVTRVRGVVFGLVTSLGLAACGGGDSESPAPAAPAAPAASAAPPAMVFTGARVIVGDGTVIDNATFTIGADNRFGLVGATAAVTVPAGGTRVDLTGMTVMPTIVDTHVHLSRDREALTRDLQRRAYFGVSAAMSLGQDQGSAVQAVRGEAIPGAALYRTAGRGITAPEPGRNDIPYWITTADQARTAVQEQAEYGADIIKVWVDDRNGQYTKLSPELYRAVIDAAHAANLRVVAHVYTLADAKGLVNAGVDAFAHGVRDTDVDDELVGLLKAKPNFVLGPNLPDRGVVADYSWLSGALPAAQVEQLQAGATDRPDAQQFFGIQARNLARLAREGVTIVLGTDGNSPWAPHVEMADMVASGMSPADVIVAATRNGADYLRLTDAGTIAGGKSADFIVLEANPLDDITNTRRIRDVYIRGARVDRSSYN